MTTPVSSQSPLIPAKAGIQEPGTEPKNWVPASAGTSGLWELGPMSVDLAPRETTAYHRTLATGLFDALRAASSGVGINRDSYGEGESEALDLVEDAARE